jgi:hypothetical protein
MLISRELRQDRSFSQLIGRRSSREAGIILSNVSKHPGKPDILLTIFESVWDLRSFKKPVAVHSGLTTLYPNTNAVFSPDDKHVLTGAAALDKGGAGRLMFMKKDTLELVKSLVVDATPVKVAWHSKINQVSFGSYSNEILFRLQA